MQGQIQESESYFNDFCVVVVKNGQGLLFHETAKSAKS